MNLVAELLKEHSKAQTDKIVDAVCADDRLYAELIDIFLTGDRRPVQRAAWVLSTAGERYPDPMLPYLPAVINRMSEPGVHNGVKRHVVRLLQFITIPEDLHGMVMNVCFDMLANPAEAVAVRCCAMTVLDGLSKQYPDIRGELVTIIQNELEHESTPAFRARAKQVMRKKR